MNMCRRWRKLSVMYIEVRMAYGLPYGMASRDVAICFFLIAFLYSSFGHTVPKPEKLPEFLAPLENHTVTQGRDVSFTCVVNHLDTYKVAWIKSDSRAILAIHTHMVAHNPRLSVTHNGHNTWKLHVSNVQPNDSGTYMCQVNTDPMRNQIGRMKVYVPPDIVDMEDGSDQLTTEEDGDVRLRCHATGTPKPEVVWRREDGRNISLRNERGIKVPVKSFEGEELHLTGVLRQEMGSYLCIASNNVPPAVSKRYYVNVLFKPLIKVSNQLVVAPANSDVILQCLVESSPKPLNTWHKGNGIELRTNNKHVLSEIALNDYTYQLNLTIKNLNRPDFGSYTCSAENAHGKSEGVIRLQEMHPSRTTIASVYNPDKSGWRKQSDKKGKKGSHVMTRDQLEPIIKGSASGESIVISNRNSTNTLSKLKAKNSIIFPAPASAPAHSAPTQMDVQNVAANLLIRDSRSPVFIICLLLLVAQYI